MRRGIRAVVSQTRPFGDDGRRPAAAGHGRFPDDVAWSRSIRAAGRARVEWPWPVGPRNSGQSSAVEDERRAGQREEKTKRSCTRRGFSLDGKSKSGFVLVPL